MHMQVRIVASMPCYSESNVNEQRGRGVFQRSIEGLQALNRAGYGQPGTGLHLDLVYNPNGAFLAPPSSALQVRHQLIAMLLLLTEAQAKLQTLTLHRIALEVRHHNFAIFMCFHF